jgi:hypothetical protein
MTALASERSLTAAALARPKGQQIVGKAAPDSETAASLASRARERKAADALGDALSLFLDASLAYAAAGDADEARRCATHGLALWPEFEASKRIDLRPAKRKAPGTPAAPRARRLPGARETAAPTPPPARPTSTLPSMFVEMHAELLRLSGDEKGALARFAEAQATVEGEVARRRASQEWGEAFSAALSMVRLAAARGGGEPVAAARRSFIEVAREAAFEALTPEYFARGKDALPREAVEAAAEQARLLDDAKLIVELDAERASVLRRTAEVLGELADERTAAEAILAWEDAWPYLTKNKRIRTALLDAPQRAADLTGPLADLAKLAATHPSRLEVSEFAERHAALVERARERALQ